VSGARLATIQRLSTEWDFSFLIQLESISSSGATIFQLFDKENRFRRQYLLTVGFTATFEGSSITSIYVSYECSPAAPIGGSNSSVYQFFVPVGINVDGQKIRIELKQMYVGDACYEYSIKVNGIKFLSEKLMAVEQLYGIDVYAVTIGSIPFIGTIDEVQFTNFF